MVQLQSSCDGTRIKCSAWLRVVTASERYRANQPISTAKVRALHPGLLRPRGAKRDFWETRAPRMISLGKGHSELSRFLGRNCNARARARARRKKIAEKSRNFSSRAQSLPRWRRIIVINRETYHSAKGYCERYLHLYGSRETHRYINFRVIYLRCVFRNSFSEKGTRYDPIVYIYMNESIAPKAK